MATCRGAPCFAARQPVWRQGTFFGGRDKAPCLPAWPSVWRQGKGTMFGGKASCLATGTRHPICQHGLSKEGKALGGWEPCLPKGHLVRRQSTPSGDRAPRLPTVHHDWRRCTLLADRGRAPCWRQGKRFPVLATGRGYPARQRGCLVAKQGTLSAKRDTLSPNRYPVGKACALSPDRVPCQQSGCPFGNVGILRPNSAPCQRSGCTAAKTQYPAGKVGAQSAKRVPCRQTG